MTTDGTSGYGAVPYVYAIGTYVVTNAQYAEFLNAKVAASDPFALYNRTGQMSFNIARSGSPGSYSYAATAGNENKPVVFVNVYDALRFANWMNNGQGNADTESGAYTLLGGTPTPSNGGTVTRNPGATIVLPSEDEWYKAAYYNPSMSSYFAHATGSNTPPTCAAPSATPNTANCAHLGAELTPVGAYSGSASPYGTFDQAGNVYQWTETIEDRGFTVYARRFRGGSYTTPTTAMGATYRYEGNDAGYTAYNFGFRLAMVPEPRTGLLVIAGLLGLAIRRKGEETW
jgi:formylglycine-generating enzyme required for sulfatase activity